MSRRQTRSGRGGGRGRAGVAGPSRSPEDDIVVSQIADGECWRA